MTTCATTDRSTAAAADREARVLRWIFRRDDNAVVCELGLNTNQSAYELRVNHAWSPTTSTTEQFDDAMSAFQRHAAIERKLVADGWILEDFESERTHGQGQEAITLSR